MYTELLGITAVVCDLFDVLFCYLRLLVTVGLLDWFGLLVECGLVFV